MIWVYGDENNDRTRFPLVTLLFIGLNLYVFIFLQQCGTNAEFTYSVATVPAEIVTGEDIIRDGETRAGRVVSAPLYDTPISVYLTLLTALFMHGGILHIFSNMLFFFIFGDNVENRLGKIKFVLFYLGCGVVATLGHIATVYITNGNPFVPLLGASGAISGVLGGYILFYPKNKIKLLFWLFIIPIRFRVRAIVFIGVWFGLQLLNGISNIGSAGGVSYAAHVCGFLSGVLLALLLRSKHTARWLTHPPPQ